jgi:3-oxoacyl-[acyl-carrier protein] reductase
LAETLLQEGWRVSVTGQDRMELESLKTAFTGFSLHAQSVPVQDIASMQTFIDDTERLFGPIDTWINNAAIAGPVCLIEEADHSFIEKTISINLTAVLQLTAMIIKRMKNKNVNGVIVNLSSEASKGAPCLAVYSASKAAVDAFSVSIANEYQGTSIHIFALNPGRVLTPMFEKITQMDFEKLPYVSELRLAKQQGLVLTPKQAAQYIHHLIENPEHFESQVVIHYNDIKKQMNKGTV